MKQAFLFAVLFLITVSCETTKVIYQSKSNEDLNKLGAAQLDKKSPRLDSIFPKLDSTYIASVIKYGNRFLAKETMYLDKKMNYFSSDTVKISERCTERGLDGMILTYVDFRLVQNYIKFVPADKYFECVLRTKIYDKSGKLLYEVVHDSKDDSYDKVPTTYDVVRLSIGISYKKINAVRQK